MFDIDRWQEIMATIRKNKLRTALTMLGVFWGIFMLLILLGSGRGLSNGVKADFGNQATNSFYVWTQRTRMAHGGFRAGRSFSFTTGDVAAIRQQVPEVGAIAPRNQLGGGYRGGAMVTRNNKAGGYEVTGDYPAYFSIRLLNLSQGRLLNDFDLERRRKVAVIGEQVRKELFEPHEDPIGGYIKIKGVYYQVVGEFTANAGASAEEIDRQTRAVFLPFTTFQQVYNYGDRVGWFAITSADNVPASVAEAKVRALLARRHTIHPEDRAAIGSFNSEEEFGKIQSLFTGIRIFIWVVGLGTLAAGVIGVSNIMLIIVKERTKEIGVRKALGATPGSIVGLILQESVFITAIAGYVGLLGGLGLLELINYLIDGGSGMFRRPEVDVGVALSALGVLVLGGLLAGWLPAFKAVRISPIEAIRQE